MNLRIEKTEGFKITDELPEGVSVTHKGRLADGRLFVLLEKGGYHTTQVFVGSHDSKVLELKEVEVIGTERMRDGGTTIIKTKEGIFYFPSPLNKGKFSEPTFGGEKIEIF